MALLDDDDPMLFPKLTDEQLALLTPLGTVRSINVGDVLSSSPTSTAARAGPSRRVA